MTYNHKAAIQNRLDDERATLQRKYNLLSQGLDIPGVDVQDIKARIEKVSAQLDEVRRQQEQLSN